MCAQKGEGKKESLVHIDSACSQKSVNLYSSVILRFILMMSLFKCQQYYCSIELVLIKLAYDLFHKLIL